MAFKKYLNYQSSPDTNWYEAGRKFIFKSILDKYIRGNNLKILDVGCGSGDMLDYYRKFGTVKGLEKHPACLKITQDKGHDVRNAFIEEWPFGNEKFDIISFFDVLEHVKDDVAAIRMVYEALAPGGLVIISVPAFKILWGPTDIICQHIRRYKKMELTKKLENAGFKMKKLTYFNFYLAPLIFPFMIIRRIFTFNNRILTVPNQDCFNYRFITDRCRKILFKEAEILPEKNFWFGLSLFAIGRKQGGND